MRLGLGEVYDRVFGSWWAQDNALYASRRAAATAVLVSTALYVPHRGLSRPGLHCGCVGALHVTGKPNRGWRGESSLRRTGVAIECKLASVLTCRHRILLASILARQAPLAAPAQLSSRPGATPPLQAAADSAGNDELESAAVSAPAAAAAAAMAAEYLSVPGWCSSSRRGQSRLRSTSRRIRPAGLRRCRTPARIWIQPGPPAAAIWTAWSACCTTHHAAVPGASVFARIWVSAVPAACCGVPWSYPSGTLEYIQPACM